MKPRLDGVVLFRRQLELPAAWAERDLGLELGAIDDQDRTFFNGVQVGATRGWTKERRYLVPAAQVNATVIVWVVSGRSSRIGISCSV